MRKKKDSSKQTTKKSRVRKKTKGKRSTAARRLTREASSNQMTEQRQKGERNNFSETAMLQVLKPDGHLAGIKAPSIPTQDLLSAYKSMLITRSLDERLISLQRQGRLGTYVACSGQEAAQIGTVIAMSKKDWLFPMYRDTGMVIQMGVPLDELLNRLLGNSKDSAKGRDLPNLYGWRKYRIASFAAPIASHLPVAVGFAMGAKIRGDDSVTVTTFGDGATSSGEFHVAMNFAGVYKAATVFVCENNQYAISVPVSRQTASSSIAIKAQAYGFEGIQVDGNDILAVYLAVRKAIEKAKAGGGPSLVECLTYRLQSHSTADDWKRYRSNEEVEYWRLRDPVKRLKLYLQSELHSWSENQDANLKKEVDAMIAEAVSKAESIGPPDLKTMFEDVYSEIPWNLKEEQSTNENQIE